jgi:2-polyprenyl-6-methoxyphenol hydroxylase-like FAD-dependent oxidoreductase
METDVLISGSGIAGLTLALKLVSQGVNVTLLEKSVRESVLYKGELLQPKSIAILDQLGLMEQISANGWRIPRTIIHEQKNQTNDQQQSFAMDYGVLPHPYNYALMIPHDRLKSLILQAAVTTGRLQLLRPAQILKMGDRRGEAIISVDGEQERVRAHFFVGAEGKFSTFRETIDITVKKHEYNHQFLTVTIGRPDTLVDATVISEGGRFIGLFPLPDNQVRTVLLLRKGDYKRLKSAGIAAFHREYVELAPFLKEHVQALQDWKEIQLMVPLRLEAERYVSGQNALIGDAAHSVHPMAGEGMNMAIQDADILGSLLAWMLRTGKQDEFTLQQFERIRKPRAMFVSGISHMSALAYSYPLQAAHALRARVLRQIAENPYLMKQYMVNISGLGMAKESLADRVLQLGVWPKRQLPTSLQTPIEWFSEATDYPWLV